MEEVPRPRKFTKEELEEALSQTDGDLQLAAIFLGCNLATVYRALRRYGVVVPKDDGGAGRAA